MSRRKGRLWIDFYRLAFDPTPSITYKLQFSNKYCDRFDTNTVPRAIRSSSRSFFSLASLPITCVFAIRENLFFPRNQPNVCRFGLDYLSDYGQRSDWGRDLAFGALDCVIFPFSRFTVQLWIIKRFFNYSNDFTWKAGWWNVVWGLKRLKYWPAWKA